MKRLFPILGALVVDRLLFAFWPEWTLLRPDLISLAVVYSALAWSPSLVLPAAWTTGLLVDFSGWGPLGAHSGGLTLVALVLLVRRDSFYPRSPLIRVVSSLGAVLLVDGLGWALAEFGGSAPPPGGWSLISAALLSAALAPPLFHLWDRLLGTSYEGGE